LLEDAALKGGADAAETLQQRRQVEDAQLNLDFAIGSAGHGTVLV
jgi:hypothetical protein